MNAERTNPFPGLRSFEPEEEHLFFGREQQVDELLARLHQARLLTVVGSSGSGKSSIVKSGVIPALYGGYVVAAGSSWRIANFRPGDDPIGNLAAALARPGVLETGEQPESMRRPAIESALRRSSRGLVEAVREARLPDYENLLVLVDQFEELFRFKRSAKRNSHDDAAAFVRLLLEASMQEEVPVYLILTMRSDFLDSCVEFQGLAEAINRGQYLVPRMTREQQRLAITGPVAVAGGEIAPRLVLRLLNDVGDDPDQLPILQHALMRTWDHWSAHHTAGEPIDLPHYDAVGTMREALSLHAEEAFLELDTEPMRRCAELVFKGLTEVGRQGQGIRRPATVQELSELGEFSVAEVIAVVEPFRATGRTFVVPPPGVELGAGTVLDISHESLMRVWTRLRAWVQQEAVGADLYRRLAGAAALHQEGRGGLWRDPELQLALRWRSQAAPTVAWAQRYDPSFERAMIFLELSREERRREIEIKERLQRRRLVFTRLMLIAAAAVSLVLLVLGLLALDAKQIADEQRAEAVAARATAQEETVRAQQQADLAEQQRKLAQDAERQAAAALVAVEGARRQALEQGEIAGQQRAEALRQEKLAAARAGQALDAQQQAEAAHLDADLARRRSETLRGEAERAEKTASRLRIGTVARSIADQAPRLLQGNRDQLAALAAKRAFDLNAREGFAQGPEVFTALENSLAALGAPVVPVVAGFGDAVRALAAGPDGRSVAAAGDDGSVRLLDLAASPPRLRTLDEGLGMVRALAWSRDGGRLAAGGLDGAVLVWTMPAGTRAAVDLGRRGPSPPAVHALAFSPAADLLAVGDAGGAVTLWDLDAGDGSELVGGAGTGAKITGLAFAPGGDRLAASAADGRVRVWRIDRPEAPPREVVCSGGAAAVAFDRRGELLGAGGTGGAICRWRRAGDDWVEQAPLVGHRSIVNGLDFSPDDQTLASASSDGTVRLWPLGDGGGGPPVVLAGSASWVWAVTFIRAGAGVVAGGAEQTLRIWHTRAADLAALVCDHVERDMTAAEWRELVPEEDLPYEPACPGRTAGG